MTALRETPHFDSESDEIQVIDGFDETAEQFMGTYSDWMKHRNGVTFHTLFSLFRTAETYYQANRDESPTYRTGILSVMAIKCLHASGDVPNDTFTRIMSRRSRTYESLSVVFQHVRDLRGSAVVK